MCLKHIIQQWYDRITCRIIIGLSFWDSLQYMNIDPEIHEIVVGRVVSSSIFCGFQSLCSIYHRIPNILAAVYWWYMPSTKNGWWVSLEASKHTSTCELFMVGYAMFWLYFSILLWFIMMVISFYVIICYNGTITHTNTLWYSSTNQFVCTSMDWLEGKSEANHRFSHEIWGFRLICSPYRYQSFKNNMI